MTFDRLVVKLTSFHPSSLGTGAKEVDLDAAERALGVPIRGSYRSFVMRFGWGGVADFDMYGLGAGTPPHLDLVRLTQSERSEMYPPLPRHLLPVLNDGGGNLYCLDTSDERDEPPIVVWYHDAGAGQTPEPAARDFSSWLASLLEALSADGGGPT